MARSSDCLPSREIGGFLSVPGVVRSPVVKNRTAACLRKSPESKTRPSLVAVTSKPCFVPSKVIPCSTMLGFPSILFTTSCSKPDDFVNTSTDFFSEPKKFVGRAILAPVIAVAFMNPRRLKPRLSRVFIDILLSFELSEAQRSGDWLRGSIGIRGSLSPVQPQHSAIRFPVRARLGKIVESPLGGLEDVPRNKGRALFRTLLAVLQAALPFEDRPSGKIILRQLGEDRGKINLAVS